MSYLSGDLEVHQWWYSIPDVLRAIILVGAAIAACAAIWKNVFRPMVKFCQRIESALNVVEHELTDNTGTSLKDVIRNLGGSMANLSFRLEQVEKHGVTNKWKIP